MRANLSRLTRSCQVLQAPRTWTYHELGTRRAGVPSPGHKLPLRGNTRDSLDPTLLADLAMRGFDISCLRAASVARSAFFFALLVTMADDCMLQVRKAINSIQIEANIKGMPAMECRQLMITCFINYR
jgi:hypothetical protein